MSTPSPLLLLALSLGLQSASPLRGASRLLPPPLLEVAPGESLVVDSRSFLLAGGSQRPRLKLRPPLPEGIHARIDGEEIRIDVDEKAGPRLLSLPLVLRNDGRQQAFDLPLWLRRNHFPAVFRFRPEPGKTAPVALSAAGAFNGWQATATPLLPEKNGHAFSAHLELPRGRYPYKLVMDGTWTLDDANPLSLSDGFGGRNSLKVVSESAGSSRPRLIPLDDELPESPRSLSWAYLDEGLPSRIDATNLLVLFDGRRLPSTSVDLEPPPEDAVDGWQQTLVIRLPGEGTAGTTEAPPELLLLALNSLGEKIGPLRIPVGGRAESDRSWRDRVLYFAMTDRFHRLPGVDAPPRDPRVPPIAAFHGGSLKGLQRKIEEGYFERLGVDALWIAPVNRNPAGPYRESVGHRRWFDGYHGYWPTALHAVDPRQGNVDDLKALVEGAHGKKMTVLLDLVCNHVHESSPLYRDHPDWFTPLKLADGRNDVQLFDENPYTTWFDTFLPSFAYEIAPDAVEAMTAQAVWWMKASGADGFRLDAVKHVPPLFWRALRTRLRREVDGPRGVPSFLVGETIADRTTIDAFLGPDLLDGQFQFPLYWSIRDALGKESRGLDALEAELSASEAAYPQDAIMSPLLGNHDFARFLAYAEGSLPEGEDEKELGYRSPPSSDGGAAALRLRRAFTFMLGLNGLPLIYYGDEIGLTGAGDPDNRRPMQFENLAPWQEELFAHVSKLTRLRKAHRALRRGQRLPLAAGRDHLVFAKVHPGDRVIVALNRSSTPQDLVLPIPPGMERTSWRDAMGTSHLRREGRSWKLHLAPGGGTVLIPAER